MTEELVIKIIADWAVVPVILLGVYTLVFKIKKGQRLHAYKRILMAGLTAYLIAKLASAIYQPSLERPFELLGTVAGASFLNNPGFPSDHIVFVAAIVCAVWFETRQKLISLILILLVISIGLGRVLALVHTPIDVIGGVAIALMGSVWHLDNHKTT